MERKHKPFNKESGKRISFEDLIRLIGIKCRDKVEISNNSSRSHHHKTFIYRKTIGEQYVYVEEIRIGRNKSLAFQTLYKRPIKKPPL